MGIPSYYRTLCKTVPSLLQNKLPKGTVVGKLWIDFNCIVYHCIRKPGTPEYPGEAGRVDWEEKLIEIVCNYVKELENICNPTDGVYIAIDGVVPMAKMRQQRKRRHKSVWLAQKEVECGKPVADRWDSNCITPGTLFMEKLASSLKKKSKRWTVSCAEQPGEGEQKLFHAMRKEAVAGGGKDIVVYGLDADLILMSMLHQISTSCSSNVWLFREHTEFGGKILYKENKEEYRYLHIQTLVNTISSSCNDVVKDKSSYIIDYCASMMLLGNDFLPHGIWFTIRDGGHTLLEELLKDVRSKYGSLVKEGFNWNLDALKYVIGQLALKEESYLLRWIKKKSVCVPKVANTSSKDEWEHEMERWNNSPLTLFEEKCLLKSVSPVVLSDNWRSVYNETFVNSKTSVDLKYVVKTYIEGLDWSLKYISGESVSWTWTYPWSYPPLWEDIYNGLELFDVVGPNDVNPCVTPQEQLALVLPIQSWSLLRDEILLTLPKVFPHLWNFELTFCTVGKRMMWECDPHVPLILPSRLRFLQNMAMSSMTRGEERIKWDKHNHNLTQHIQESIQTYLESATLVSDTK
jgi:5'-3' exonuclease